MSVVNWYLLHASVGEAYYLTIVSWFYGFDVRFFFYQSIPCRRLSGWDVLVTTFLRCVVRISRRYCITILNCI